MKLIFSHFNLLQQNIVDDELHNILVKAVPRGCKLIALLDCCHSGTGLDLQFIYTPQGRTTSKVVDHKITEGDVICYSGCADDQKSADTIAQGRPAGAMTFAFRSVLRTNPEITYFGLLTKMKEFLDTGTLRYTQIPHLSTSHSCFDVHQRFSLFY